jgi:hypothetical protein
VFRLRSGKPARAKSEKALGLGWPYPKSCWTDLLEAIMTKENARQKDEMEIDARKEEDRKLSGHTKGHSSRSCVEFSGF